MTNKKIASEIAIGIILLLAIAIGGIFWMKNRKEKTAQIANPASIFCKQNGGKSVIKTNPDSSQTGFCVFANGKECEEWAFFQGKCSENSAPKDETVEWQTYTDTANGFEFQYPANLVVQQVDDGLIIQTKDQHVEYAFIGSTVGDGPSPIGAEINFAGAAAIESDNSNGNGHSYSITVVRNGFEFGLTFIDKTKNTLTDDDKKMIASFKFTK